MDDTGCRGCLSTVATLVAIVAGLISIISFFFSDSDSFLQALSQFLNRFMPTVSIMLADLSYMIEDFVSTYPATTWITALLILIVAGLVSFWIHFDYVFDNPIYTLLILSPLAFAWVWVFSGVISTFFIILFVIVFIVSVLIAPAVEAFA